MKRQHSNSEKKRTAAMVRFKSYLTQVDQSYRRETTHYKNRNRSELFLVFTL
jgi:hypothetical protein